MENISHKMNKLNPFQERERERERERDNNSNTKKNISLPRKQKRKLSQKNKGLSKDFVTGERFVTIK